MQLTLAGVTLYPQIQVTSIRDSGGGITVGYTYDGKKQECEFERVIVSAGGKAYPSLGSRGELFPVLETLGHTVLPKRPALAPLLVELGDLRFPAGGAPGCGCHTLERDTTTSHLSEETSSSPSGA